MSLARLPWLIFAFFVICFALHPASPLFTHHLADPDDYMRLNEVIAWLGGQNWHDLSVPRMSPGAHTVIHWSRLVDFPIAAAALPFIRTFGITNAALIASFIVPLFWFACLLVLIPALARPLLGDKAPLASIMLLWAPLLLFNYTPGRVDHHGMQMLIAAFGLLAFTRILIDEDGPIFAGIAAFLFACGFWIGAEALPWAILFITSLSIAAAWIGKTVMRDAAIFGLCLPTFTATLIPIALPTNGFSSRALSWFSPAYVIFAALAGAIFILGYWSTHPLKNRTARISIYAGLSIAALIGFFALLPNAARGPFTDYDTFDATTALNNIIEAQPIANSLHINRYMPSTWMPALLVFFHLLFLPLAALIYCLFAVWRASSPLRQIWIAHTFFLTTALLLAVFWQMRVGIFMELFSIVPLAALLIASWEKLSWRLWDRQLFTAEIAIFLILGPLPVILLPAFAAKTPIYPDLLLFPASRPAPTCDLTEVTAFLNTLPKPHTIMNSSDNGPELLFSTHDNVVAGNFDVPGNADAYTFFHALDDTSARMAARKWNADYALACKMAPALYLGKDYFTLDHVRLEASKDGMLRFVNTDARQPLIERMIRGSTPAWLKPVEIPGSSDYLLFQIEKQGRK